MLTILLGVDAGVMLAVVSGVTRLRFGELAPSLTTDSLFAIQALVVTVVCQLWLGGCGLYEDDVVDDPAEVGIRGIQAIGATSITMAVVYTFVPGLIIGRGVFIPAAIGILTVVMAWRNASRWVTTQVSRRLLDQ